MVKGIYLDPETKVIEACFAVVYAPRRKRDRFPADCVEVVDTPELARERAEPARMRYPAKVIGPSRSSEGLRLYYLVEWLDEPGNV